MIGFVLYGLFILTAGFSIDLNDLYGTWTWPVEEYGNAAEYGWEENSMILHRAGYYTWYDEEGYEMLNGDFWFDGHTSTGLTECVYSHSGGVLFYLRFRKIIRYGYFPFRYQRQHIQSAARLIQYAPPVGNLHADGCRRNGYIQDIQR